MNHLKNRLQAIRLSIILTTSLKATMKGILQLNRDMEFNCLFKSQIKIKNTPVNSARLQAVSKALENMQNLQSELFQFAIKLKKVSKI
jgi:hypothetical protein